MVPLPYKVKLVLFIVELIIVPCTVLAALGQVYCKLLDRFGVITQNRPSVNPLYRLQGRNTSYCAVILEHHGVPVTVLGLDDSTLSHTVATTVKRSAQYSLTLIGAK